MKWFFFLASCLMAEEQFLLIDGTSNQILLEKGELIDQQITPCSTFKIALSLIGFDASVLIDGEKPVWFFQEGYEDFSPSWKKAQTPTSWLKTSCVWYSRVLAQQLGEKKLQLYLEAISYGNQDLSGGFDSAWLSSSLKISIREQVSFLQRMLKGDLPISSEAVKQTRALLFLEEFGNNAKLFGKTGWSGFLPVEGINQVAWFVGWVEQGDQFFPFAYQLYQEKIDLEKRISRVKELIEGFYFLSSIGIKKIGEGDKPDSVVGHHSSNAASI